MTDLLHLDMFLTVDLHLNHTCIYPEYRTKGCYGKKGHGRGFNKFQ